MHHRLSQIAFFQRLVMTLVLIALSLVIWHTLHILMLIFLGIILAVFLHKSGTWIAVRTRLPIWSGISLIILLLAAFMLSAAWVMTPRIVYQAAELSRLLPSSWQQMRQSILDNPLGAWLLQHLPPFEGVSDLLGGLMHQATNWIYSAVGLAISGLIIAVLSVYFAYGCQHYIHGLVKLAPKDRRDQVQEALEGLGNTLYWWLCGRLISMLIIWTLTVPGLWLLGIPLALTLGTLAAVLTFIPNLGPIVAVIPAVLLALQFGWSQAGYVIALYASIQAIESNFVTPIVQRRMVSMPPGLILSSQLIMGVLQGVLGILVATPLVAFIMVLTKRLYIENVLNDDDINLK